MIVYARNESHLRTIDTYWREEKPGAKEIHEEYLRLRKLHGSDNNAVEAGIREFYKKLPKSHPAKKHSRYSNVDNSGVWRDDNMSWPGGGGPTYDVSHPTTGLPCAVPDGGWRYSTKEKMLEMIEKGVVVFRKNHTDPPIRKTYLLRSIGEDDEQSRANSEDEQDIGIQVQGSVFYKSAQPSSKLLAELFGKKIFDNPKDHEVIGRMIRYCCDSDSLILDFFAGSGTTGHAVLDINRVDGGNRKYILVQLPEKTDFEEYPTISHITRERVRRAIAKIDEEDHQKPLLEGKKKTDRGFRVLRLSSSNFKIWDAEKTPDDPAKLAAQLKLYADNVERKRGPQDILYELILKSGLPLSSKVEKISVAGKLVWSVNDRNLLILLENKVNREVLRGMLALKPQQMLCLDIAFGGDDALKTNTVLEARSQGVAFHTV
jgi:adenine-specific DNA-methyltransferase